MPSTARLKRSIQTINKFLESTVQEGKTSKNQQRFNELSVIFSDEYVRLQRQGMTDAELQKFLKQQVSGLHPDCERYFNDLKDAFFNQGKVWN